MLDNTIIMRFCHKEVSSTNIALLLEDIRDETTIGVQDRVMLLTDRVNAAEEDPCFVLGYN